MYKAIIIQLAKPIDRPIILTKVENFCLKSSFICCLKIFIRLYINYQLFDVHGKSIHSYLNASTGFLVAALRLCQLIVNIAIPATIKPARTNIHKFRSVLYAKLSSHLTMAYQAMGQPIRKAKAIHLIKSLFSMVSISITFAPFIFRIPISLILLSK